MAPNILCWRKKNPEKRTAPPKYAQTVSVSDKAFFLRLLLRWTGSIWQMLWLDLLVFVLFYIAINLFYIFYLLNDAVLRQKFESFVQHVQRIATNAPLSFLLGFFVSAVLARWWSICMLIPWMTQPSVLLNSYISDAKNPELARKIRLNILRYMNLAWIIAMKPLCLPIYKRFSIRGERKTDFQKLRHTMDKIFIYKFRISAPVAKESKSKLIMRMDKINSDTHVKKSFGRLISEKETKIFAHVAKRTGDEEYQGDYWLPIQWSTRILKKARECGMILSEIEYTELISMVDRFRGSLGSLSLYYDINIPLVYSQVIIIAVYAFFIAEIFSSQLIKDNKSLMTSARYNDTLTKDKQLSTIDNYIPIFSIFKFIFTMGWFKTAASLLNPLGNDKHDLPTNLVLDYNLAISIQSGDALDAVYPAHLTADGDPAEQLEQLDLYPIVESTELESNVESNLIREETV